METTVNLGADELARVTFINERSLFFGFTDNVQTQLVECCDQNIQVCFLRQPCFHLACGCVGERENKDFICFASIGRKEVLDLAEYGCGLASSGSGHDKVVWCILYDASHLLGVQRAPLDISNPLVCISDGFFKVGFVVGRYGSTKTIERGDELLRLLLPIPVAVCLAKLAGQGAGILRQPLPFVERRVVGVVVDIARVIVQQLRQGKVGRCNI